MRPIDLVGKKLLVLSAVDVGIGDLADAESAFGSIFSKYDSWSAGKVTPEVQTTANRNGETYLIFNYRGNYQGLRNQPIYVKYDDEKLAVSPESQIGVGNPLNLVTDIFDRAGYYADGIIKKGSSALKISAGLAGVYFAFIIYQKIK